MRVIDRRDGSVHHIRWNDEITEILDKIERTYHCEHPEQEVRQFRTSNGGIQIKRQCVTCGAKTSNPISKSKIEGNIPNGDETTEESREIEKQTKREDAKQAYLERQIKRDTKLRQEYDAYLTSQEWKLIRKKVLHRANGICEGCLEREAADVHHLNYRNFQNEFMFELVAVCRECHERLHRQNSEVETD